MSAFDCYARIEAASFREGSWSALARELSSFRLLSMHIGEGGKIHLMFESTGMGEGVLNASDSSDGVRFALAFIGCVDVSVSGWGTVDNFAIIPLNEGYKADFHGPETSICFRFIRLEIQGMRRVQSRGELG